MSSFFHKSEFIKTFPKDSHNFLLAVGYHDFKQVRPMSAFRVMNYSTWHFIITGSGTLEIGGKKYQLSAGDLFFTPADVELRYFPSDEDPWAYMWFSMNGPPVKYYSSMLGLSRESPVIHNNCHQIIYHELRKLLDILFHNQGGYYSMLSCFYKIVDVCTHTNIRTNIHDLKRRIDESFMVQEFNIDQLCRDVGYSHAYILKQFKAKYSITIVKYLVQKRIELACHLLATTNLSVKSVAFSCGFSDDIYFMKTFKKEMGITAQQYRTSHR